MNPCNDQDEARASAALERLAALHPKLIDLGLERTFELLAKLGNPHRKLPKTVHVAGTNGKGSVIAIMRAMAEAAGLRVNVYTSPHLCHFNERIRLAGTFISNAGLADLLEEVETANGDTPVTFFEVTTAAAMLAFSRQPADLLLLETGLGGALDSTNVLDNPAATVITPIARDHEHFLGSDIAGIARQKAGIMRANVPCFSALQTPDAAAALGEHADNCGAHLFMAGTDFDWHGNDDGGVDLRHPGGFATLPRPSLRGTHQQDNAALAAMTMLHILPDVSPDVMSGLTCQQMLDGVGKASWPGRMQILQDGALTASISNEIWLDGAHNAHGAAALAATLPDIGGPKWHIICGALNTRDPAEFLAPLAPLAASVTTITIPDQPASLSADDLCKAAMKLGMKATPAPSLNAAITQIDGQATPIIICGSLYLGGHVLLANNTPPR